MEDIGTGEDDVSDDTTWTADAKLADAAQQDAVADAAVETPSEADEQERIAALVERAENDPRSRAELLSDLDTVEAQRDEYLDDLRRAHADFENYRKRVARDSAVQREQGRADVVLTLLDVLDDLERLVTAAQDDEGPVASAVRAVNDKTRRALEAHGVVRVDEAGVAFDPNVHDAVQQVEDETLDAPVVRELLRPGYRMGERVLRAAMVVVAQ
jgi:molecular chaperone GrpE